MCNVHRKHKKTANQTARLFHSGSWNEQKRPCKSRQVDQSCQLSLYDSTWRKEEREKSEKRMQEILATEWLSVWSVLWGDCSLVRRWFRRPGFVDGSRSSLAPRLRQLHRLWQTQLVWAVALHKLYLPHNEHILSSRKADEGRLIRCLLRSGCHNACTWAHCLSKNVQHQVKQNNFIKVYFGATHWRLPRGNPRSRLTKAANSCIAGKGQSAKGTAPCSSTFALSPISLSTSWIQADVFLPLVYFFVFLPSLPTICMVRKQWKCEDSTCRRTKIQLPHESYWRILKK